MKLLMGLVATIVLVSSSSPCRGQGTFQWTVTFDGPPSIAADEDLATSYYSEGGMLFEPIGVGQFGRSGGGIPQRAYNGTAFLFSPFTSSLAVTGASRFGLVSVDLAEYSTVVPDAVAVQFVGYRLDGSTVTSIFTTDGIMDGSGPLTDFQTFYFDTQFADVVKVEVPTYGWSLDNMVFSNVIPEPGTWALLLVGGLLFGALKFRRRDRA